MTDPSTSYQAVCEFVRRGPVINLSRACYSGELPVSYGHARQIIKQAIKRGDLRRRRVNDSQGRPMILESAHA